MVIFGQALFDVSNYSKNVFPKSNLLFCICSEEEVPYFRIHHNLLPFPEHYTDAQRQYLAYRSTLLSAALHNEVASATSALTSPACLSHVDSAHFSMAHPLFGSDMDTKTILRRQLMKRKMTSSDATFCSAAGSYTPELYGVPPNKMLIRSSSELPYPSGPYHIPLQHSSSFTEGALHPHFLYRGISGEESYFAQIHNSTNAPHAYLFDSGYAPLTPSRKPSFSFLPSQRSPAMRSNESVSPVNGLATHNQNNNAQKAVAHHDEQYYGSHFSRANKSPLADPVYYHSNGSPQSQVMPSPTSPAQQPSPAQRTSVDGGYLPANSIIDADSICGNASSPSHVAIQQQCSVSSPYRSPQEMPSYQQPITSMPQSSVNHCGNISPPYGSQSEWNQASYAQDLSTHPMKEEALGSPHCNVMNTHCSSPQSVIHPGSPYNQGSVSPSRSSPNAYSTSSCAQIVPEVHGYGDQVEEKPYHVQYSISSSHRPVIQQCPATALYAANQPGHVTDGGVDWMKKYRSMSTMVSKIF